MNKRIAVLVMMSLFLLTGCSHTKTGIDQLIAPPKLSSQQSEIFAALEQSEGKNINLKYPKKGDYTSAFLINDLDNEITEEAIVFYETQNSQTASLPLKVSVLDQRNGEWISTYDTAVEASEVEKVDFVTVNETTYIIIGFNQGGQGEKLVKLYNYSEGKLNEISSTRCNNYEVFNIDGSGATELITLTTKALGANQKNSSATVYSIGISGLVELSHTDMDPNVTEYVNVNGGKLSTGVPALYLDGSKSSSNLSTEILTFQQGKLENLVYNQIPELNIVDETVRYAGSLSLDLERDSVFLVPNIEPALGYEKSPKHQAEIYTDWYEYDPYSRHFNHSQRSYIDYNLGFIFTLPKNWHNTVTLQKNVNDNEVLFYEFSDNIYNDSQKLLSIKVVKKADYNQTSINNTHRPLKDNGQLMYLYKIYDTGGDLEISEAQIIEHFNLLNGGSSHEKNPGM